MRLSSKEKRKQTQKLISEKNRVLFEVGTMEKGKDIEGLFLCCVVWLNEMGSWER